VDQETQVSEPLLDREVARLLRHQAQSGFALTAARRTRRDPRSIQNSTYRVRSETVSTVKKSHAPIPLACARRNSAHDRPCRQGAGPRPERRRIDLTVVAPTRIPSLRSSPWIRTQPQRGFSRPSRTTNSTSARSSGGRPTQRRAVTPLPPIQLPMPTKQRLRRRHKHRPAHTRQQSARRRQHHPITPAQRRPPHTLAEHGQLMPKHRVLNLQRTHRRVANNEPQQPPQHHIGVLGMYAGGRRVVRPSR
jgi:hypothetical protein